MNSEDNKKKQKLNTRELRLDYILRSMSLEGPPIEHDYIDKVREKRAERMKPFEVAIPNQEPKADKGYRKILLVGYNGDLIKILEKVYQKTEVKKLEFFLANSTNEARKKLSEEKFDYVFTAGLRADPDESRGIQQKRYVRGMLQEYVVPSVMINGYDIGFIASKKRATTFIYDGKADENRAKMMGSVPARSPMRLECELKEHEKYCKAAFETSRAARYEFIQALRKEKQERRQATRTKEIRLKNLAERMKRRYAFV